MWPNPQETAYLVVFTGEILNGKLHFCAVYWTDKLSELYTFRSNTFQLDKRALLTRKANGEYFQGSSGNTKVEMF